jgi:colanic acid biosynthesis glycosyl transferase WcaI
VSVPSKTYSILAAARPVIASIDPDSAVHRLLAASGGGITVPPDDLDALVAAVDEVRSDPARRAEMGNAGRAYVERVASPAVVGREYERILRG